MRSARPRSRLAAALLAAGALAVVAAAVVIGPTAAFHLLPPSVTGEEARLASLLDAAPGKTIAEIGAGTGALSVALARRLQPGGTLYSTELNPRRRQQIRERAERERVANVIVIEAGETSTGLPDACCDAIFMRDVYHHIADHARFNEALRRAVRPGGALAIIDFEPGTFRLLARRPDEAARERTGHGVSASVVAREIERAGFHVERVLDDWGGRLYLVLFRAPADVSGSVPRASPSPRWHG